MKKYLFLVSALIAALSFQAYADELDLDTDAIDMVGTSYSSSGKTLLLGIKGNNTVIMTLTEKITGSVPGAQAEVTPSSPYVDGGYLRYTAQGYGTCKITVETTTDGYLVNEQNGMGHLVVWVSAMKADGSAAATLGTIPGGGISVMFRAQEFITKISGTDTYTGTLADSGAHLRYRLFENPGVTAVDIVFTIIEV